MRGKRLCNIKLTVKSYGCNVRRYMDSKGDAGIDKEG